MDCTLNKTEKRTFFIDVRFGGLVKLTDHAALEPYQGSGEEPYHPSDKSHYGKPELNAKLLQLAEEFQKIYPDHKIWVNDMSLPTGGMFKTFNKLDGDHKTHMWGEDVDIS
ncbi:penicillin-insensitive murein endopeptidase [bacterium]|nr:penicillin-insensitive murein endopeptidase [bacterium]